MSSSKHIVNKNLIGNSEIASKTTKTFNPDAPEFSPSRPSGTLNADAPEFIPGQLISVYEGKSYYSEMQDNSKSFKSVQMTGCNNRPISQHVSSSSTTISASNKYVPIWVQKMGQYDHSSGYRPLQQVFKAREDSFDHNVVSTPVYNNRYGKTGSSNLLSEGNGIISHFKNEKRECIIAESELLQQNIAATNEGATKHNTTDGTLVHSNRSSTDMACLSNSLQSKIEEKPVITQGNVVTADVHSPPSLPIQKLTKTVAESGGAWNGRMTFADMMKRSVNRNHEIVPPEFLETPTEFKNTLSILNKKEGVSLDKATAGTTTNNKSAASETKSKKKKEKKTAETKMPDNYPVSVTGHVNTTPATTEPDITNDKNVSFTTSDGIYSVDAILTIGWSLHKRGEFLKMRQQGHCDLLYSLITVRGGNAANSENKNLNRNFEEHNNSGTAVSSKSKNDNNWRSQRRQGNHQDSNNKSFSNFRCSNVEFSREHLEAVSIPQASESSWIIRQHQQKQDKDQQLIRKIVGLLNRLTFEKFDTIYDQIISCGLTTADQAFMLVKIVFEKAITQHHFIPMYVELCAKLAIDLCDIAGGETDVIDTFSANTELSEQPRQEMSVSSRKVTPSTTSTANVDKGKRSDFMRILLNCSQDSFENNLKPLEIPPDLDGDDRFEYEQKYKHRMRGNMMFVGELFKQKLLAAKLLITCLDQVFAKREECVAMYDDITMGDNHLEAMCTLLLTVGRSFDTNRWKHLAEFEKRIQLLTELGKNTDICFRIRCLIQNVLDSRQENWDKTALNRPEGPCKLQELRSKLAAVEQKSSTHAPPSQEDSWRTVNSNKRRGGGSKDALKASNAKQKHTNVQTTISPSVVEAGPQRLNQQEIKKQVRSIVSELVLSHDLSEANFRVQEMNLANESDEHLYSAIFTCCIESCAKTTAEKERSVVLSWLVTLAKARCSKEKLMDYLKDFICNDNEFGYNAWIEDYPILPDLFRTLLDLMQEDYNGNADYKQIRKMIAT